MPTNIYRKQTEGAPQKQGVSNKVAPQETKKTAQSPGIVTITIGNATLRAQLSDTPTAHRFWQSLPIFSVAETWGDTIHFETHVPTGRDRTARINARHGDICFWTSDNRVIIVFGPSPISRPGEIRLPQLCNIFATALDDPSLLKIITPGEKVSITAAQQQS